jgi:hypothetical protein
MCTFLVTWAAGWLNRDIPALSHVYCSISPGSALRFNGLGLTFQEVKVQNDGDACEQRLWVQLLHIPAAGWEIDTALTGVAKASEPNSDLEHGTVLYEFENLAPGGSICLFVVLPTGETLGSGDVQVWGVTTNLTGPDSSPATQERWGRTR